MSPGDESKPHQYRVQFDLDRDDYAALSEWAARHGDKVGTAAKKAFQAALPLFAACEYDRERIAEAARVAQGHGESHRKKGNQGR